MTPGLAIAAPVQDVQLGAGASLSALQRLGGPAPAEAAGFERALAGAMQRLEGPQAADAPAQAMQRLVQPLEHINAEAASLGRDARAAAASGQALTPGELVNLTVRCQEFMFHCQLTSNIANRTSEGLQQLFRQQS
jgi:hypothetical protein